jgi:hypothetical protein
VFFDFETDLYVILKRYSIMSGSNTVHALVFSVEIRQSFVSVT